MRGRRILLVVVARAIAVLWIAGCGARAPERPSIVVILVDDLGAFDLASYGHPYHRTPSIDRLAREGLRFAQAYAAAPVCAPTRAALLTGKSPARLHLTHALPPQQRPLAPLPAPSSGPPVHEVTEPQSATWLAAGETTIAKRLRERGYRTALIGKWHLGTGESGPEAQGFDVAIGGEEEAAPRSFFAPYGLSRLPDHAPGEYLTDRLTDEALAFLEASAGEPFFLVLSHFAVHTPIEADAETVRAWRQRLATSPPGDAASDGSLRPAYAAMLESLDHGVGRLLQKIDELGLARDTLVVFTSDNGGLVETPDTGQAVTVNGPLRGGKGTLYEGGLRVPLVVRWPAVVESGVVSDVSTTTADWYPTLAQIAGAESTGGGGKLEAANGGARQNATLDESELDGESLLPVLRGGAVSDERSLYFHYPHYIAGHRRDPMRETWWNTPGAAIRKGDLKLVRRFDAADELYDLSADPGESRDLAAERQEDARRLADELERWLASEGAHRPRPNPAHDARAFERELERAVASLGRSSEWTPNGGCTSSVRSGRLSLDCEDTPFIVGPEMAVRGPLRVAVRFEAVGTRGAPALWYRSVAKPWFRGERAALAAGAEPGVREGRIDAIETIRQLRIDFGRGKGGRAEADWIRIYRDGADEPLVEWAFDR